ncbi:MAG: BamA/TamA family outer membrane protein, partial [Rhodospirillaceae bacterium]|nr:BamA/TamA family outer membrane protein [Rhodospirillaceae bacterium]
KIFQRYQLGGNNLRGFDDFGASPRDLLTGDALGGDWIATAKAEIKIPLGLPEEIGITPKIFTDWGSIGAPSDLKDRSFDILQSQRIRGSVGVGIEWESPVGPINIDWAHVLRSADFDITQNFRVNFGQRF